MELLGHESGENVSRRGAEYAEVFFGVLFFISSRDAGCADIFLLVIKDYLQYDEFPL